MAGEDAQPGWRSAVVDVTDMSLPDLVASTADDDSPLAWLLRRVTSDVADPGEPVAGFNSAL